MVDRVVEYCDRHVLLDRLLAEVKQFNPGQYTRLFESQHPAVEIEEPQEVQPAKPTPEPALNASNSDIPTVTLPLTRHGKKPPEKEPAKLTLKIPTFPSPTPLYLVRVPADEFQMGSVKARDKYAEDNELLPHPVHVPELYIGRYPVTNIQYRAFVNSTRRSKPEHWERGRIPNRKFSHPVVCVTWHDAVAFCIWLSQQLRRQTGQPFRLPTEAEWEKAARGTDGRIYPWGDDPPDKNLCNFKKNVDDTTLIGRYSPQGDSPYACADMAGNVWEWCQSLYRPYPYQADDGREDLEAEGYRVLRGGAFDDGGKHVRCACRIGFDPDAWNDSLGFRVVLAPSPSTP
jgi:formylglycine-generating enzyme required for sulfatase activity